MRAKLLQSLKRRRDTFGLEEAEEWIRKLFGKREKRVVLGILRRTECRENNTGKQDSNGL